MLDGCTNLVYLQAWDNRLPTAVLDHILQFLDSSAGNIRYIDLSGGNEAISTAALDSYQHLASRCSFIAVNLPNTNSVPGPSENAITFITTGPSDLEVVAPGATVVWHSGYDGHYETNPASFQITNTARATNFVQVLPPHALTSFGQKGNSSGGHIPTIQNLSAFTNLNTLNLWVMG